MDKDTHKKGLKVRAVDGSFAGQENINWNIYCALAEENR
jgi:hypothetical protein